MASRRSQQGGMHSGTASEQHASVLYFRPEPMSIFRAVHNAVSGLEVRHQLFEEPFFVFVFDVKCWVLVSPYFFRAVPESERNHDIIQHFLRYTGLTETTPHLAAGRF